VDVLGIALLDGERRAIPIGRAGEGDDGEALGILMQIVDHDIPALRHETGDQGVELHDFPIHLGDAETLGDLLEDADVDAVVFLRRFVPIGIGRIVGDAEGEAVGNRPLVGAVAAVEADAGEDEGRPPERRRILFPARMRMPASRQHFV
jgi:hypothetical protein